MVEKEVSAAPEEVLVMEVTAAAVWAKVMEALEATPPAALAAQLMVAQVALAAEEAMPMEALAVKEGQHRHQQLAQYLVILEEMAEQVELAAEAVHLEVETEEQEEAEAKRVMVAPAARPTAATEETLMVAAAAQLTGAAAA